MESYVLRSGLRSAQCAFLIPVRTINLWVAWDKLQPTTQHRMYRDENHWAISNHSLESLESLAFYLMSVLLVEGPLSVVLQSIRDHAVSIGVYTHAYWTTAVTSVVWGALVRLRDVIEQEDVRSHHLHFSSNNFVVHDILRIFSRLVLTFAPRPLTALVADVSKSENHELKLLSSSRTSMDTIHGGSVLLWLCHGDRLECPNVIADGDTAAGQQQCA